MDEIFERIKICDGGRRVGYASVRYPVTGNKRIDKHYGRLAEAFLKRAEAELQTGALNCRVSYSDESLISVITEARLYKNCEPAGAHRSSFVWDRADGTLKYLKKLFIRRSNVYYDGRELRIFD